VAIDGISLTVTEVSSSGFGVSVIPHTAQETILSEKKPGSIVNLENDMIGKYVEKLLNGDKPEKQQDSKITMDFLAKSGF
jgi:riboflavin synthase